MLEWYPSQPNPDPSPGFKFNSHRSHKLVGRLPAAPPDAHLILRLKKLSLPAVAIARFNGSFSVKVMHWSRAETPLIPKPSKRDSGQSRTPKNRFSRGRAKEALAGSEKGGAKAVTQQEFTPG